jgi:arylsulfatase
VELAGTQLPAPRQGEAGPTIEGLSLVKVFQDTNRREHRRLFWDLYGQQAVVDGKWKFYSDRDGRAHLYDLETDGTETIDLAGKYPRRMAEQRAAHAAWAKRCNVLPYERVKRAQAKHRETANTR